MASSPNLSLSQFKDIFNAALTQYTQKTGVDISNDPITVSLLPCDSSDAVLAVLQERALEFDEYRNGGWKIRFMRCLKPTVDILIGLSGVLSEGIGLQFPPAKVIFAGVGLLLSAAKDVSKSYDALIDLFERFEHYLSRLKIFTEVPSAVGEILVKIMVELLGVLALATQQVKQGRLKKFAKKLMGENDIEAVLQRLDRLTMEESRMTVAQTMQVVLGLFSNMKIFMDDGRSSTENIQRTLVTTQQIVDDLNKIKRDQLQEKIRKWLSPPDPSRNHLIACEVHHTGTGDWFTQGPVYNEWKAKGSLLWLYGKPGSGKSVLCSSIIKDVEAIRATGLASVAYYYFDFNEVAKQDRRGLLSSLLIQLCARSHHRYDILSNLHAEHDTGLRQPSESDLLRCLGDVLQLPGEGKVYIIVDALEECPNASGFPKTAREKVLDLFEELVDWDVPDLRICVTSRPEVDIQIILEPLVSHHISLHDESGQKEDIINYILHFVQADRKMKKWRPEDKQLVIDTLSTKADGMFRWVVCQLDMLRRSYQVDLHDALNKLPNTLDETYERILLGIEKEKRDYSHRLFQCLAVSVRPLRIEELAEILAMRFDSGKLPEYRADWREDDAREAVLSGCSSLVAVAEVDGSSIVFFSHFSVKEFMTSNRLAEATANLSRYHIVSQSAHTFVADASLGILLHLGNWVDKTIIKAFHFASYAARYWVEHGQFEGVSSRIQDAMIRLFDLENPSFATWLWIYDIDYPLREHMFTARPTLPEAVPLYYASLCGFHDLVKHLLDTHPGDVKTRGGRHTTPLFAALAKGHFEIAELLIERGAEVDALDNHGSTALHGASFRGQYDSMQFLLKHRADTNIKDRNGDTSLLHASCLGELEVARILLQHRAAVDSHNNNGWTPLYAASRYGHPDIVLLLVQSGAAVDTPQNDGWTPLFAASRHGHLDVVRLLVERSEAVDSRENKGWTPLCAAARYGFPDIVELLIEKGAVVDLRFDDGWTPLFSASRHGHLDTARLLIQHGATVDHRDNESRTPLAAASRYGHTEIVRLLIEKTATVDSKDNDGWTPLFASARYGHLEVVQLLTDSGAEVDCQDNENRTPLFAASIYGHPDIAELLIEKGAAVDSTQKEGLTPLFAASQQGHLNIVRLLVRNGAAVDARDNQGWTPLMSASRYGHLNIAQELLKQGADANAQYADLWTSLHLASANGHLPVATLLVLQGAEIDKQTKAEETPLNLASGYGHLEIMFLLLKRGSNPNTPNRMGWTPLHKAAHIGRLDIVKVLLQLGARVDVRNGKDKTPFDVASANGKREVARFLLESAGDADAQHDIDAISQEQGSSQNTPTNAAMPSLGSAEPLDTPDLKTVSLHIAAIEGKLGLVKSLLVDGANVNERGPSEESPLAWASITGRLEVAKVLIENGADVNSRDKYGGTPLHRASRYGHQDVARLLLDYGSNVNAKKQDGWSPLHLASGNAHVEVVQLLLERGADIEIRNSEGRTPADEALRVGQPKIAGLLSQYNAPKE